MKLEERVQTDDSPSTTPGSQEEAVVVQEAVPVKVFDCFYQMESVEGYTQDRPVIHCICRDSDRNRWHVQVEKFNPYFLVPRDEVSAETLVELNNDPHVLDVCTNTDPGLRGRELVKITTVAPYHVPQLRDAFSEPYEADVRFDQRFLADMDINQAMAVPRAASERRITPDEVESADDDPVAELPPRILYIDIEVEQTKEGPAVVSETGIEMAKNPIFAVTCYDSYTENYVVWVLAHTANTSSRNQNQSGTDSDDYWDSDDFDAAQNATDHPVHVYGSERSLLQDLCSVIGDLEPDVITAWNAPFDLPYTVNRCMAEQVTDVFALSPVGEVDKMSGDGSWINSDLTGVVLFDLLQGFKKTSRHELDSNRLEHVAKEVTDLEKLDVDEQDAWVNNPADLVKYNLVDVKAMVKINDNRGIL